MRSFFESRFGHYTFLLIAGVWMFFTNLGGPSLWDVDEGRNAMASVEMLESGNYIVPTFNAQLRVDKPALIYWLQIGAYKLFGVGEFAARFPSALAALAVILLAYELARSMFNAATGILTGLVAASTPMLCGAARFANPDSLLHAFTVLTLLIFWLGYEKPRGWWFAALGAASGFAVLAKGPVGVILPGAIIFLFLLWQRQLRAYFRLDLRWAVLTWSVVALPWYIWVALDTKADFLRGFFMNHNVNRFLSPMENHNGSPLYYPAVMLVGLAPWSIFFGLTLWYGCWSAARQPSPRFESAWRRAADGEVASPAPYRFLMTWIVVYLVFFTLAATKLPNYVLPVVIPCAVLTARFLDRWRRGMIAPPAWTMRFGLFSLALVGVGVSVGLLIVSGFWPAPIMRGRTFAGLEVWAVCGLVPVATALVAGWFLRSNQRTAMLSSIAVGMLAFLGPLAAWASEAFNRLKAPRPLTEQTALLGRDRDLRIGTLHVDYLPSLNFYLQRDLVHFQGDQEAVAFLRYPIPAYLFVPEQEWRRIAPSAPAGCSEIARHADLYRHQTIVVIANCEGGTASVLAQAAHFRAATVRE